VDREIRFAEPSALPRSTKRRSLSEEGDLDRKARSIKFSVVLLETVRKDHICWAILLP
jgi:hypothetical protein